MYLGVHCDKVSQLIRADWNSGLWLDSYLACSLLDGGSHWLWLGIFVLDLAGFFLKLEWFSNSSDFCTQGLKINNYFMGGLAGLDIVKLLGPIP